MQTPLQLDIWWQSHEGFDNAKDNIKQRNFSTVFANISDRNIADIRLIPLDHVTYDAKRNNHWMIAKLLI